MNKTKYALAVALISVTLAGLFGVMVFRAYAASSKPPTQFRYAAKWICADVKSAAYLSLVEGEYKTDINVHNPSSTTTLTITKTFVLSVPEAPAVSSTSVQESTVIAPNAAFYITCDEILALLDPSGFLLAGKGFVTLTTTTDQLDVVAEYSAQSLSAGGTTDCPSPAGCPSGISLDVVPVPAQPFVP